MRRRTIVIASIAAVLAVAAAAVVGVVTLTRAPPADVHTAEPTSATIVVVGNSFVGGSGEDSGAASRFPALLGRHLGANVQTITADGSGYVTPGAGLQTFGMLAAKVRSSADLVIILGSDDDAPASFEAIQTAAQATFATIERVAPHARILVVGTPWVSATPPDGILRSRDAVKAAAASLRLNFVDPIADKWWVSGPAGQVGGDGLHPTDVGQHEMYLHLLPVVERMLRS